MNSRERKIRAARKLLTDERLMLFLRSIRTQSDLLAVRLLNDDLDQGQDLDAIFYTGDADGFSLSAKKTSDGLYRIEFGCVAGPMAGDGGEWHVSFDADGVTVVGDVVVWTC